MRYKPDEATLIAYHYGELEGEELKKVEVFLQQNPEEKRRLDEWQQARFVMASLQDKEVIAPPLVMGNNQRSIWQERYVRMTMGIAASFLVLLVTARLLNLSASINEGEFKIAFGAPVQKEVLAPGLDEDKVKQMIQTSLQEQNAKQETTWLDERKRMEESIQKNLNANSGKIDRLVSTASAGQEEQVKQFVSQLQTDNLKLMREYLQLSTTSQKEYVENLLVDFSKYLQEQRKQDLQYFQASMTNMKDNTDQFKKDTEQILTSLITNKRPDNLRSN